MILALVRHGQTDYNLKKLVQGQIDNPLNETGILQAQQAAEKLKISSYTFNKIAASTLSRALNTANEINKILNIDSHIYINPLFMERDFAYYDGKDVTTALAEMKNNENTNDFESNKNLLLRANRGLSILKNKYINDNIILCTHSHFIKAVLININPNKYDFDYFLANGHIFIIKYENNKFEIIDEIK